MTAAGRALAGQAAAVPPALARIRPGRDCGQAEAVTAAHLIHGILSSLASAINQSGWAMRARWRWEFSGDPMTAPPEWVAEQCHAAASAVQLGANATLPIRAARTGKAATSRAVTATVSARQALDGFLELLAETGRAGMERRPQVPEWAEILGSLRACCAPAAQAAAAAGPLLAGVRPDPASIWCAEYDGDLPGAYAWAAGQARLAGRVLQPVTARVETDAAYWRLRNRPRPQHARRWR